MRENGRQTISYHFQRLKELLQSRLVEIGWQERLKDECEAEIRTKGLDSITAQELIEYSLNRGKGKVI